MSAALGTLVAAVALVSLRAGADAAGAADLQPAAVEAWDRYVRQAEVRIARELASAAAPVSDSVRRTVASGAIAAEPCGRDRASSFDAPGALLHHWCGAVLLRGVTLDRVLDELQSPDGTRHVQQDVLEWRLLARTPEGDRVFLKLVRDEIVTVTYNTEHQVKYVRHSPTMASSRSVATRIAELEHAGTPDEREKEAGRDRGFLWRLNSYWRYEQLPGGVLISMESLTLSRNAPMLLKPFITPIVNGIARKSIVRTLEAVRARMSRPPEARH
jgi:hypothetical protein